MQRLLSQLSKISRICSTIIGILLILHSLQVFYALGLEESKYVVFSLTYMILAVLLIISEFHLNFIAKYFKIVDGVIGRGIYTVCVGTLLIAEPEKYIVSFLLSLLFMLVGFSYIILGLLNEKDNPNNQKLVEYVQKDDSDAIGGEPNSVPVPVIKI